MAEKAAHFTATSHPKPSLFEVIAQDSLHATIYPALQKITLFLSSYSPKRFSWLVDYCDEFYLALNGLLQYYYINKYDASFSEHFYGLKRVLAKNETKLTADEHKLSLIYLVVLPYLKIKIEERLSIYRLELADGVLHNNWVRHLKSALCSAQAMSHVAWYCWSISQHLRYMSGRTDVQSPAMCILKLKLIYAELEEESAGFWSSVFRHRLSLSQMTTGVVSSVLTNSLELGAFFMQFLHSWQNEKSHIDITSLPVPTPPQYDGMSTTYAGVCPLCMQSWCVPTVVAVSGYVYCFRCIIKHLQEESRCPVTKLPASVNDIIRIYDV